MIHYLEKLHELQCLDRLMQKTSESIKETDAKTLEIMLKQVGRDKRMEELQKKHEAHVKQTNGAIENLEKRKTILDREAKKLNADLKTEKRTPVINLFNKNLKRLEKEEGEIERALAKHHDELARLVAYEAVELSEMNEDWFKALDQDGTEMPALQEKRKTLEMELMFQEDERARLRKLLPEKVYQEYERLSKQKPQVIALVTGNRNCEACGLPITLEVEIKLRKGLELVNCDGCGKILFWKEAQS